LNKKQKKIFSNHIDAGKKLPRLTKFNIFGKKAIFFHVWFINICMGKFLTIMLVFFIGAAANAGGVPVNVSHHAVVARPQSSYSANTSSRFTTAPAIGRVTTFSSGGRISTPPSEGRMSSSYVQNTVKPAIVPPKRVGGFTYYPAGTTIVSSQTGTGAARSCSGMTYYDRNGNVSGCN
jgi:hypothetical protein